MEFAVAQWFGVGSCLGGCPFEFCECTTQAVHVVWRDAALGGLAEQGVHRRSLIHEQTHEALGLGLVQGSCQGRQSQVQSATLMVCQSLQDQYLVRAAGAPSLICRGQQALEQLRCRTKSTFPPIDPVLGDEKSREGRVLELAK